MATPRPILLVFGNCQAEWLRNALAPILQDFFDLHYLANYSHGHVCPSLPAGDAWPRVAFLLQQVAPQCPTFPHAERLPAHCKVFRFPTIWLKPPWPLDAIDPVGGEPEEGFPFGRFIHGDRLAIRLRDQGLDPEEQLRRYFETDIRQLFDLDRLAEMAFAELEHIDTLADLQFAPFVQAHWRELRLFSTINHPCFLLLDRLMRNALAFLFDDPTHLDTPAPPHALECMGDIEVPVHPQVAEHYGLAWAPPGIRWRYRSRMLDYREYMEAYLRLEAIPEGEPADLWLGRAEQAALMGNPQESFRLLAEGLGRFPQTGAFYRFLSAYLREAGKWDEARRLLDLGLAQTGGRDAELHAELGMLARDQGRVAESADAFRRALGQDPGLERARLGLASLGLALGES